MISVKRTALFCGTLAGLAIAPPASAQVEPPVDPAAEQLVDRIIAIVGDSAILWTEIEQGLILAETQGWRRPTEPEALFKARSHREIQGSETPDRHGTDLARVRL